MVQRQERSRRADDADIESVHATNDGGREKLSGLLERMRNDSSGEEPSVGDILGAVGTRAYGPLLFVPAIIALAPTGAIPGMSMLTGSLILAISLQMLFGRDQIWMPQRLLAFSVPRERLENAIDFIRPYAERVDRLVHPRQTWLAKFPFTRMIAVICGILAISMFPLAFVPFGAALPSGAIVLFSLGLVIRDGYVVIAGLILAAFATWFIVYLV